jgi:hypothetical protein
MNVIERLQLVQSSLVVGKSQYNDFGKYAYRNAEDILEAFKLVSNGLALTISDEITLVSERIYVTATATVTASDGTAHSAKASAREPLNQKGMNEAQITGSASSYARKYALNGLFAIDDTKDDDSLNNRADNAAKAQGKEVISDSELASKIDNDDKSCLQYIKKMSISKKKSFWSSLNSSQHSWITTHA